MAAFFVSSDNTVRSPKRLLIFTVVISVITIYTFKRQKPDPQKDLVFFFAYGLVKKIV